MKRRRRCNRPIGWCGATLLMGLLAVLMMAGTRLNRLTFAASLEGAIEAKMIAWDEWQSDEVSYPGWLGALIEIEEAPERLQGWMKQSNHREWTTDRLRVTWAIACHRFSQSEDREKWLREGRKSLGHISPGNDKGVYYTSARKALEGSSLSQAERAEFQEFLSNYRTSWFVKHLARAHGFDEGADGNGFEYRGKGILGGMFLAAIGSILLIALAVPCALLAWRMVRRNAPSFSPGLGRLSRVWPISSVLGTWALWQSVSIIGGFVIALAGGLLIARTVPYAHYYWVAGWFSFLLSFVTFGAVPVLMKSRLTRSRGILRRAFAFKCSHFFNRRTIFVGVSAALALSGSTAAIHKTLDLLGHPIISVDQFMRGFDYLGAAAFPAMLVYGCLLAPVCEEIMFRGFIFTSMRARWGPMGGAVASSLVFSAVHAYGWVGTIHIFVMGLFLCWAFHRSGRLSTSMILHASMNFIVLVLNYLSTGV